MKYKGIITPMLTPFDKKGRISRELTEKLLEKITENKVHGLFPLGSTGLFPFLSIKERKTFLEIVNNGKGKLPVFAGIGSSNTEESVELAKHASDIGADVLVLMPPYYITPGQEEIKSHFARVLSSTDSNLFIYNIPQLSGTWISFETMLYLKEEYSQIKGVKESSGDMRRFQKVLTLSDRDFTILQGQDDLIYMSLMIGADGGICGTTNIMDEAVRIYKNIEDNRIELARKSQLDVINPLMESLNSVTFPSGYYHAMYESMEAKGGYRIPMIEPGDSKKKEISTALRKALEKAKKYK